MFSLISENLFCRPDFEGVPFLEDWFSLKSFGAMAPAKLPLRHRTAKIDHEATPHTLFPSTLYSNGKDTRTPGSRTQTPITKCTFKFDGPLDLHLSTTGHRNPEFNRRVRLLYGNSMDSFDEVGMVYRGLVRKNNGLKRTIGDEHFDTLELVNEVFAKPLNLMDRYRGNLTYSSNYRRGYRFLDWLYC